MPLGGVKPRGKRAPPNGGDLAKFPEDASPKNEAGGNNTEDAVVQKTDSAHRWSVTIVAPIEAGACGEVSVIRYTDPSKGKDELRVMKEMSNKNRQKCEREKAQFNRQSCHPNMIKYFYYGPSCTTNKDTHTQVQMELMDLGSLKMVMDAAAKGSPLGADDRLLLCRTVGFQILMALDYFHFFHGGMHRDIKPANILINSQGRAKLCDFDSSVADSNVHDTGIGTVSYAAPEVIAFQPHDFKCDIWSAATVIFEIAAGKHPYMQGTSIIGGMIAKGSLSEAVNWDQLKDMPPSLTDLLKGCLTEKQSERFSAAEALSHPFFEEINKERRRDQRAETQLKKMGLDVDPENTQKMHLSWKNFVAMAEGGNWNGNNTITPHPQRTSSSLGAEEIVPEDGLNSSVMAGGGLGASISDVPSSETASPRSTTSSNGSMATPILGHPPGSQEAREKAMKVSNVMKSILYNWEYAAVTQLANWIKSRREVAPIVKPENSKSAKGTPHS